MVFDRIAVIGVGLIGGSLGLALKRTGFTGQVVGVSRAETISQALDLGVIDEGYSYEELPAALSQADLVFLCTPIERILELLPQVMSSVMAGAVVTDVGSTKRMIVAEAARCSRDGVHFVGGHPMAGSEKAGVTAADPFLFQNAIYILVPDERVPDNKHNALVELVRTLGAKVFQLSVDDHDEVVAAVSHLPQMMATTLVEMVGEMNEEGEGRFLPLAAGGFRDLTRIASSPFSPVWADICATNRDRIVDTIDRYIDKLRSIRDKVGEAALGDDFAYANSVRDRIPRDAKGFLHTLFEILVVAEDRPGVIAEIASVLSGEGVNINDIEVVKVREGEGGTLRLGFDSDEAAIHALALLQKLGYQARRP
jgi:prephenate dehydrogenase